MPLGFSYQPGLQDVPVNGQGNAQSGYLPQGAARILSLRIPQNVGPSPIAPRQLLTSPGSQGAPDLNALIGMLLRTMQPPMEGQGGLGGGFGLSPLTGAGTMFPPHAGQMATRQPLAPPPPRITPGEEPNQQGQGDTYGGWMQRENDMNNRGAATQAGHDQFSDWMQRERDMNGRSSLF